MGLGVESILAKYLEDNQSSGGGGGSILVVATFADLPNPPPDGDGTLGYISSTQALYIYDGSSWIRLTKDVLTANIDFYVSTTGDNNNVGTSSGAAWATPQYAWDYISTNLDYKTYTVSVNIADGSYKGISSGGALGAAAPQGLTTFVGNTATPTAVILTSATGTGWALLSIAHPVSDVSFKGITFNGTFGVDVENSGASVFTFNNCVWGTNNFYCAIFTLGSNVSITGTFTIQTASLYACMIGSGFAVFQVFPSSIITTTAFSGAFYTAFNTTRFFQVASATKSGVATGRRFNIAENSGLTIFSNNDVDTKVPGDQGGLADNSSFWSGPDAVQVKTTAYTVTTSWTRYTFTNTGATARVDFTLPTATANSSLNRNCILEYTFVCNDTDGLRVIASGTDTINVAGTISAAGGRIDSTQIGATVKLVCNETGKWVATQALGTWTVT